MSRFDYFVLFAEMRTGSNHVEESINAFGDLHSYGEVFNPVFMGHHNLTDLFGYTMEMRNQDPLPLLKLMVDNTEGLPGFRFFHDHDPRVLDTILSDPRAAKVFLTRNPVDSFVSLEIARSTGQWRLMNEKKRKSTKIYFDTVKFDQMVEATSMFRAQIDKALRMSGQAGFELRYEDITDVDVINGLGRFLGAGEPVKALPGRLKRQNPGGLRDKVENFDEMQAHLAARGGMTGSEAGSGEPERGAGVPSYMTAAKSPLLFQPIEGGPTDIVRKWLFDLDRADPMGGYLQKSLRPWMRKNAPFTSFTVVSHPLDRAHRAFCERLLPRGVEGYEDIRRNLINHQGVPIPRPGPVEGYSAQDHYSAFKAFLEFVKRNLNGATGVRTDAAWASQLQTIAGMGPVSPPARIFKEHELQAEVEGLAEALGQTCPELTAPASVPFALQHIHDRALEDVALEAYRRDYLTFGYKRWDRMQKA